MGLRLNKFPIHLSVCECVCVFKNCLYASVCVYMSLWACVYVCVTWGRNSAQDSFIKCGAASEAAVNQFYLLCVGGQLSWHPQTMTPQEWTGWILLLQLCCCRLVVKGDLFFYGPDSPEEQDQLRLLFSAFSLVWMEHIFFLLHLMNSYFIFQLLYFLLVKKYSMQKFIALMYRSVVNVDCTV